MIFIVTESRKNSQNGVIGRPTPIMDACMKVTGQLRYTDDMKLPGMLYAKLVLSPLPHAEIVSIDTSEAEKADGVRAVVCYKDSPDVRFNANGEDENILPSELVFERIVRYVGDKVAAVAAESQAAAEKAAKLIKVEYRELPYCLDPVKACEPGAYPIHPEISESNILIEVDKKTGDLDKGFAEADHIYEDEFEVPAILHSAIEPHVSISVYDASGKLTVYTPSQDVFGQRRNLAKIFGLPLSRVRVLSPAIGGAFGGKIDLITEPVSALLAIKTGRPVKLVYNRSEDIRTETTRHAEKICIRTGVRNDGTITALDYKAYISAGAHSGGTMSIAWAAGGKFFKLFHIENARYHVIPVFTNRQSGSAMRGFGSPQVYFAMNHHFNRIARDLGLDLCEMEIKNLYGSNETDRNGEALGNLKAKECIRRGMELFDWKKALSEQESSRQEQGRYLIGIGMAAAPHGCSMFGILPDTCGVALKMNEDGSITMFTGVSEMGNGSNTTQKMIISEMLGIPAGHIAVVRTDTESTLFDVGAFASRGTYVGGGAAFRVAGLMKEKILDEGAELLNCKADELRLGNNTVYKEADSTVKVTMTEIAAHAHEKERDISVSGMYGTKAAPVSAGAHFVKVQVDTETDEVRVLKYLAVHDVGKPLNPMSLEGQVHGGIHMGMGYALSEGIVLNDDGTVKGTRIRDAHLFRAAEMPDIHVEFLDSYEESGPYGAKSVSECATVPAAAAVSNAVANAFGVSFRKLPINTENIKKVLQAS